MIWALGALIALLAVAGVAAPWWRPAFARRAGLRRRAANVVAYEGRLRELEADVGAGILAPEVLESARQELGARLLADVEAPAAPALGERPARGTILLIALGLVAFSGAWYALAGSWRTQALIDLSRTSPELARAAAVDDMIERLREKVRDNPNDAESWAWLGRSYGDRGNHADAARAFARASEIKGGQDPDLLVAEGEALAYAQDRALAGEPAKRFEQALALAPDHPQALWYAGLAALQAGDAAGAVQRWERLLRLPLPDEARASLKRSLAQLREQAGLPAAAPAPAASGPLLRIAVRLAPELAGEVAPDDTVFVYALDTSGSRMPLAIERLRAGALPAEVTLDDRDSMVESRRLSGVDRWRIVARVSKAGSAMAQPGDLEGSAEVDRAAAGSTVPVLIDRRRP